MTTTLTRGIFFIFFLVMTSAISAQVYWGDQPGQGDFDGGMNGWVSNYVAEVDSAWQWISDGVVDGGILQNQNITINSPTASNGAMVFNMDKFSNAAGGSVPPPPYPLYIQELVSPTIDLSAVPAGTALGIEFSQAYYWFAAANGYSFSSLSVSIDDGISWTDPIDCNPNAPAGSSTSPIVPLNNTIRVSIPFSFNVPGGSAVRIKFTIAGSYYFWALDDIKIVERPERDVAIDEGWYATAANKKIPLSQVEPMYFMTDVENVGVITAEDVVLNLAITDDSATEVYSENENYGTLTPDSLDQNRIFGNFSPSSLGTYTATYSVSTDFIDEIAENNTLTFDWEVTDTIFAKEDGPTSSIQPGNGNWNPGIAKSWTFGNHFYIVNATDAAGDSIVGNSADFVLSNAANYVDKIIYINLWKWNAPVDEWLNNPGMVGDEIYTCDKLSRVKVGQGIYTVQGTEGADEFINVRLVDPNSLNPGAGLEDDTHYLLMVEILGNAADSSNVVALGLNREIDYFPNNFLYQQQGVPRFGSMIGLNDEGMLEDAVFSDNSFGRDYIPCVRLNVGSPRWRTSSTSDLLENAKINIFPSPTDKNLTAEVVLAKQYDRAVIKVVNTVGAVVSEKSYTALQNETINFNTSNWANGTYFLQVSTQEGVKTASFIVQH